MMRIYVGCIIIFLWSSLNAQNNSYKVYRLEEISGANLDTIYAISLGKNKLTELPKELWKLKR